MSSEENNLDLLDLSNEQIDNLLLGFDLNNINNVNDTTESCISCKSNKLIIDNSKGYLVCQDCGIINQEFLDKNVDFSGEQTNNSRYGHPTNPFYPQSSLGTKIIAKGYNNRVAILQKQGQMPYKEKSLFIRIKLIVY